MRMIRAALAPLLVLAALVGLALWNLTFARIALFSTLWDAVLGLSLGVALSLLPPLIGIRARGDAVSGCYWVCAFVALTLIALQYLASVTGFHIKGLEWLLAASSRVYVAESAVMGYCLSHAIRGTV